MKTKLLSTYTEQLNVAEYQHEMVNMQFKCSEGVV